MSQKFNNLKMRWQKLRNDKSGLSLVELLVAGVILGIVVAPLLHSFTTSAKITMKSQKLSEGGDAASNILEVLDNTSVSDFQSGDAKVLSLLGGEDGGVTINEIVDVVDEDGDGVPDEGTPVVDPDADKKFLVSGLKSGAGEYEAVVKFETGKDDPTSGLCELNTTEMVDFSQPDAFFTQPYQDFENPDEVAIKEYVFENGLNSASELVVRTYSCARTITVDITADYKDAAKTQIDRIYVNVTYSYTFYTGTRRTDVNELKKKYPYSVAPAGIEPNGTDPITMYLLYYANYNLGKLYNRATWDDTFIINNLDGVPISLFIVKQVPMVKNVLTDEYSPVDLHDLGYYAKEESYKVKMDSYYPASYNRRDDKKELYTNASKNLAALIPMYVNSFEYRLITTTGNGDYVYTSQANRIDGKLISTSNETRIYQVVVEVYEKGKSGTDEPVVTVVGDKLL